MANQWAELSFLIDMSRTNPFTNAIKTRETTKIKDELDTTLVGGLRNSDPKFCFNIEWIEVDFILEKKYKVIAMGRTSDVNLLQEQSKSILGAVGCNGITCSEIPELRNYSLDWKRIEEVLPEKYTSVLAGPGVKEMTTGSHKTTDGMVQITLTPKVSKNTVYVISEAVVLCRRAPKEITFEVRFHSKSTENIVQKAVVAFGYRNLAEQVYSSLEAFQISAKLGLSGGKPNAEIAPGYSKETKMEHAMLTVSEVKSKAPENMESSASVCLELDSNIRKSNYLLRSVQLYRFELKAEPKPGDCVLGSTIILEETFLGQPRPRDHTFSMDLNYGVTKSLRRGKHIVIGGVIGTPKCGKTAFIGVFEEEFSRLNNNRETAYLKNHSFPDASRITQCEEDQGQSFSFLDTQGFYFNLKLPMHDSLLLRFLQGLPDGTKFSSSRNLEEIWIDGNNTVTHVVLPVSARSLTRRDAPRWSFTNAFWALLGYKDEDEDPYRTTLAFYTRILSALQALHHLDEESAADRIVVLVTHIDMVSNDPQEKLKQRSLISTKFNGLGIDKNFVFFGEKECQWDEPVLQEKDQEINVFLSEVKALNMDAEKKGKQSRDYWEILEEKRSQSPERYPKGFLHIDEDKCKNTTKGCKHRFTAETVEGYKKVFKHFMRTSQ